MDRMTGRGGIRGPDWIVGINHSGCVGCEKVMGDSPPPPRGSVPPSHPPTRGGGPWLAGSGQAWLCSLLGDWGARSPKEDPGPACRGLRCLRWGWTPAALLGGGQRRPYVPSLPPPYPGHGLDQWPTLGRIENDRGERQGCSNNYVRVQVHAVNRTGKKNISRDRCGCGVI